MPHDDGEFDIAHVARLARLDLTPDEQTLFQKQLADILAFAVRLRDVPTDCVPAWSGAGAGEPPMPERADEACPSLSPQAALANAPDRARQADLVRVPKVLS